MSEMRVVGTIGGVGQAQAVRASNWKCTSCQMDNTATRPRCIRCKKARPASVSTTISVTTTPTSWTEAYDPNTRQLYYYNHETGASQWERPIELGAAPIATGWFGRGSSSENTGLSNLYHTLNSYYLTRPAKPQQPIGRSYHAAAGADYNIWYGRYLTNAEDRGPDRTPAETRCNLTNDAGSTKCDTIQEITTAIEYCKKLGLITEENQMLSTDLIHTNLKEKDEINTTNEICQILQPSDTSARTRQRRFFCLHFARGACSRGSQCTYFHRIPQPIDDSRLEELTDCFGRSRHSSHRDDMNGIGSFAKPCRTLFVGNLPTATTTSGKESLENTLYRHFGEWGELESLNVIHRLHIAFPRYRLRSSAEFAKEAMSNQSLGGGEVLCVRWAHDDPNPVARDAAQRADRDALVALLAARGLSLDSLSTNNLLNPVEEDTTQDSKRYRLDITDSSVATSYPSTDEQFAAYAEYYGTTSEQEKKSTDSQDNPVIDESDPTHWEQQYSNLPQVSTDKDSAEEDRQNVLSRLGLLDDYHEDQSDVQSKTLEDVLVVDNKDEDQVEEQEAEEEEEGWIQCVDETRNAVYYFHTGTGESSWTAPADWPSSS